MYLRQMVSRASTDDQTEVVYQKNMANLETCFCIILCSSSCLSRGEASSPPTPYGVTAGSIVPVAPTSNVYAWLYKMDDCYIEISKQSDPLALVIFCPLLGSDKVPKLLVDARVVQTSLAGNLGPFGGGEQVVDSLAHRGGRVNAPSLTQYPQIQNIFDGSSPFVFCKCCYCFWRLQSWDTYNHLRFRNAEGCLIFRWRSINTVPRTLPCQLHTCGGDNLKPGICGSDQGSNLSSFAIILLFVLDVWDAL